MKFLRHKVPITNHFFCPSNSNVFSFFKQNLKVLELGFILCLFYFCDLPEVSQMYTWLSRVKHNTETKGDVCQNVDVATFMGPKQKI